MMRGRVFLAVLGGLSLLLLAIFFVKVGWVLIGEANLDIERMGYCFDAATDEAGNRLFVAAGERGLHIFDLVNGHLEYVSSYYDDGYYRNLKVSRGRAFIADSRRGLVVLDVSQHTPRTMWVEGDEVGAGGVHIEGEYAYVAAYEEGIKIFDISNQDNPVLLGSRSTEDDSWDIWVQGDYAYLADFNIGVSVVDVSSPHQPQWVGSLTWADRYPTAEILRGEGNLLYVAASQHGLVVIDISNPTKPAISSQYRPIRIGNAEGLVVRDGTVYLAWGSKLHPKIGGERIEIATTIENGLHIIDVTDPRAPSLISKVNFLGWVEGVFVKEDYVYIANGFNGVRSVDIQDVNNPSLVDSFLSLP